MRFLAGMYTIALQGPKKPIPLSHPTERVAMARVGGEARGTAPGTLCTLLFCTVQSVYQKL